MYFVCGFLSFSVINPKAKSMGNFGCLPNIRKYGDWFVELWRVQAYKLASEASIKAQTKQKEGYDLRTRGAIIEPGDIVLVRIVAFDNKHKISDR